MLVIKNSGMTVLLSSHCNISLTFARGRHYHRLHLWKRMYHWLYAIRVPSNASTDYAQRRLLCFAMSRCPAVPMSHANIANMVIFVSFRTNRVLNGLFRRKVILLDENW